MPFEIINNDLASASADAIVYADTKHPFSLFSFNPLLLQTEAKELIKSREEIDPLSAGDAKITPASTLDAQYIIHTSAPVWHGGLYHELGLLRSCYEKSFQLAAEHQCKSVALPIIAADRLGYPKKLTQQTAFECIRDFLVSHDIMVYLVIPKRISVQLPGNHFSTLNTYIRKNHVEKTEKRKLQTNEPSGTSNIPSDEPVQDFETVLLQWMTKKGMNESNICRKANLPASLISKILNDKTYHPDKKTVIALGMALELTRPELEHFLASSGYSLTQESKFDLIIEYCILHHIYDVFEINLILFRFEQNQLGA